MENQSLPLVMRVGSMMQEVFRVLKKRTLKKAEIKLTFEQFGLLHSINREEDDVIQNDMAEIMGKDKSVIMRLIDSLEEKELIRRVAHANDRRKNYLMVTKKGEMVIKKILQIENELMEELQQGLTSSDMNTFNKVVNQIKSNSKKA